jgi:hypothetical protein
MYGRADGMPSSLESVVVYANSCIDTIQEENVALAAFSNGRRFKIVGVVKWRKLLLAQNSRENIILVIAAHQSERRTWDMAKKKHLVARKVMVNEA